MENATRHDSTETEIHDVISIREDARLSREPCRKSGSKMTTPYISIGVQLGLLKFQCI